MTINDFRIATTGQQVEEGKSYIYEEIPIKGENNSCEVEIVSIDPQELITFIRIKILDSKHAYFPKGFSFVLAVNYRTPTEDVGGTWRLIDKP